MALPAQGKGKDIVIGLLKGPTGIGLERLFQAPPVLASGRKVKVILVPSVDLMLAKLTTGEVDIAALPTNTAAKIYNGGMPYLLAAVIGDGMMSFISSDPEISSPADLRGKKIHGSGQGSVPEYVLRAILKKAELDPDKDLQLSWSLPYPEAAASLIAGKIENAYLPEPFATMALEGKPSLRSPFDVQTLWAEAGGTASYPLSVLVVGRGLAESEPSSVAHILDRAKASIEWVRANVADAAALAERLGFGIRAGVAQKSIPRSNYVFRTARASRAGIETLFAQLLAGNPASLGGRLPDDAFYAF